MVSGTMCAMSAADPVVLSDGDELIVDLGDGAGPSTPAPRAARSEWPAVVEALRKTIVAELSKASHETGSHSFAQVPSGYIEWFRSAMALIGLSADSLEAVTKAYVYFMIAPSPHAPERAHKSVAVAAVRGLTVIESLLPRGGKAIHLTFGACGNSVDGHYDDSDKRSRPAAQLKQGAKEFLPNYTHVPEMVRRRRSCTMPARAHAPLRISDASRCWSPAHRIASHHTISYHATSRASYCAHCIASHHIPSHRLASHRIVASCHSSRASCRTSPTSTGRAWRIPSRTLCRAWSTRSRSTVTAVTWRSLRRWTFR